MKVKLHSRIFNKVYIPYLNCQKRTQIFFGGSSSGKSAFLAQRVVYHLLKGGHNYLICRQAKTSLRGSVITEVSKVIETWGVSKLFSINKTDGTITCNNGYQVVFAGLDDVEKLKSIAFKKGVLTDIWVEEATEVDFKSIKQLFKRQRGKVQAGVKKTLTLSFNPILQTHPIYQTYFKSIGWTEDQKSFENERLSILKTTYKDNRFLEPEDIDDLENEEDKYFYNVYTLGNWGILGNVIFTKWIVADLDDPNSEYYLPEAQRTNNRDGGDFGFSSDPAAVFISHYDRMRKRIYIYDELYERGLTNDMLALEVKKKCGHWSKNEKGELVCTGTRPVIFDSAEPKSIKELRDNGVDARPAKKGKDSVNFGIQWFQQQTFIIHKSCVNAKNEISIYHWKEDKNGNVLRQPAEKDNHLIDGGRYAYENDMIENKAETSEENPFYN